MGVIRTFLALSVLDGHYGFWPSSVWLHGYVAVCVFFIISGFYMNLVLDQKYSRDVGRFYANRLTRLAPAYYIVLMLLVIGNQCGVLADVAGINNHLEPLQYGAPYSTSDQAIAWITNLTLFPASIAAPIGGFRYGTPWTELALGQMYTVGLELLFYGIAPPLVRLRNRWFLLVLSAALAAHFLPCYFGLPSRPWQYEFFPTILVFFLLGMGAYRVHRRMPELRGGFAALGWLAVPVMFAYCYTYRVPMTYDMTNSWQTWTLYTAFAIFLPLLFQASKSSRLDRFIGDLSYPIYVSQFLIIAWVEHLKIDDMGARHWLAFAVIIMFSLAMVVLIEHPLQAARGRLFGRQIRAPEVLLLDRAVK